MNATHTVILGAGFGGAAAAAALRAALPAEHAITLVDRDAVGFLCGATPFVVAGTRRPDEATRRIAELETLGIATHIAEILAIDPGAREVTTSGGVLQADHLLVALGAAYDWAAVPGTEHSVYDRASAERLRDALAGFEGGRIAIGVAGAPIKCPPAPFEMAMVLDWALRRDGTRAATEISVHIPEPAPLGVAGPEASARMRAALADRTIELHTSAPLLAVEGGRAHFGDGSSLASDLVAVVPKHVAPPVVAVSGLTAGKPWIPVEPSTLETTFEGVFAVGDNVVIPVGDKAVPKAGAFAAGQGRAAAAVIVSRVLGTPPPPAYDGSGHCFVAFSATEGAGVGGTFLGPAGPQVGLGEPSEEGMAGKLAFEEAWRTFTV